MNLNLTGHHLEITPAIRAYVVDEARSRHASFRPRDRRQRGAVGGQAATEGRSERARARQGHPRRERSSADMYAAIDALADKLDRQVLKHKEKLTDHRCDNASDRRRRGRVRRRRRRSAGSCPAYNRQRHPAGGQRATIRPPFHSGHDDVAPSDEPDRRTAAACQHRARPRRRDEAAAVRRDRRRCSSAAPGSPQARVAASLAAREKLGSTGLGQGIAIPHGRIKGLHEARGAFVRLRAPIAVRRARTASRCRRCSCCSCPSRRPTSTCSCCPSSRRCSPSARFATSSRRRRRRADRLADAVRGWKPGRPDRPTGTARHAPGQRRSSCSTTTASGSASRWLAGRAGRQPDADRRERAASRRSARSAT